MIAGCRKYQQGETAKDRPTGRDDTMYTSRCTEATSPFYGNGGKHMKSLKILRLLAFFPLFLLLLAGPSPLHALEIEAGHAAQNVYLQAVPLNIGR